MRASLTVLLLLSADAMAMSLQSMRAPLRLRGGDDEDPPNAPVALTREQVIEKLNEIPTFALMGGEGFVALQLADGSGNAICFFIEPDEAQAVLNHTTTGAASGQNLRLACVGLGTAFRLAKGWPDDDDGNKAFASFDGQVKLQGSHRLVDSVSPKLTEMMESENVDTSSWKLPVFICEELQGPTVLPVFLNPRDIRTTWIAAGRQVRV